MRKVRIQESDLGILEEEGLKEDLLLQLWMHEGMGQRTREGRRKEMTKKQLNQIRFLETDLRLLRTHLKELEASIGITAAPQDGQPKGNKVGSPTEAQAIQIYEQIDKIRKLEEKILAARLEAWDFISTIEDPMLRQIIILRFVDGKSWFKVADAIGGNATADGCRMYFTRSNIAD